MSSDWPIRRDAAFGDDVGAHFGRGLALRLRELLEQLLDPIGLGHAGMDDVDIHAFAVAEPRQAFGEIRHRGIDRTTDQEIGIRRTRRAAHDIDHMTLGRAQQRPEQPGQAHRAEEFQRKAVEPRIVGQFDKISATRRAGIVDQHVAALETLADARKQPLAILDFRQIAVDGQRLRARRRQ